MDFSDRAAIAAEHMLADALARRRTAFAGDAAAEFCDHCEKPIPEARRSAVAGCRLCVTCQAEEERCIRNAN